MAGYKDQQWSCNQRELDPPFQDFLHTFKVKDGPLIPQLVIPVEVVEHISRKRVSEEATELADLVQLKFLFLLRVGECTFPKSKHGKTWITQFQRKDAVFYKNEQKLPHLSDLQISA